ncbi:MAG: sterol desaturase family protein [Alphaproteobacteria bacterium]|nr:sterol desaturase family protein [Alphaproteobacteria bacterium]MBV9694125.1 sterol desaturase family protein [Alphaproteobacteria bacterium]
MRPFDPVAVATPAFAVLVIAEMIFARVTGRGRFEVRDTAASLLMGLGSVIAGALFAFVFAGFAARIAPYALLHIGWSWSAAAACFVLDDLRYYWWHRASHRVRWLWADHVNHHSSQHYNLSTALRQPWGGVLALPGLFFLVPLILLGFPLAMIAFVHGLNLVYQFWIHTEIIDRLPRWFETTMNTPSHHRVHHAVNARYLDANFAGVFIVWDRVFGTFAAEDASDPPRYGIVGQIASFNPLRIALHGWVSLAHDLMRARSPRDAWLMLFAPPGWSPDGSHQTTDSIKARWASARLPAE